MPDNMNSAELAEAEPNSDLIYGYESELIKASNYGGIMVCETKVEVDAFGELGLPAICSANGKWSHAHGELLAGWDL